MRTNIDLRTVILPALSLSLLTIAGCASGQPPKAELGGAQASLMAAERAGAAEHAPVELNSARTKLEAAQEATRAEKYKKAQRLAEEADIDAQLATTKSQSASAEAALGEVRQGITTLRDETVPANPASPTTQSTPSRSR